jgi:hypothetical protein
MAVQPNYPAATPSLLLDFANNKRLDPRITFTRTTTATYYDGATTAKAEENLLLYSQEFDNAYWDKISASVSANAVVAPDGTSTAESITFTGAGSNARIVAVNSVISGATYTYSVFLKGTAGQTVSIEFDTTPGTTVTLTSTWARYSVTNAATAGTVNSRIISRTGNTATVFDAWGAQLEQRSSVTAYTATTTQPITNYIPVLQTAAAGQARFQHNPTTDESLGLLVEEASTNLLTYSDDFANVSWLKTASSITSNTIVAPDGTLTGDKLVEDTANTTHFVVKSVASVSGTTYVMSVFAKQAESNRYLSLRFTTGTYYSGEAATFNLSTGVVETTSGTTTATITSVGNGWYRCSVTAVSKATGTPSGAERITLNNSTSSSSFIYTGDGYSGIYIWGAQIEAGSNPTSYIPTVASAVTRNAETCSMQDTSSFYNVSEGTLYAKVSAIPQTGNATVSYPAIGFTPAALNSPRSIQIFKASNSDSWYYLVRTASGDSALIQFSGAASSIATIAFAYKINDFAASLNGATALTDTSGDLPLGSEIPALCIGSFNLGGRINGTINKIAYYPVRITNANLQALTS